MWFHLRLRAGHAHQKMAWFYEGSRSKSQATHSCLLSKGLVWNCLVALVYFVSKLVLWISRNSVICFSSISIATERTSSLEFCCRGAVDSVSAKYMCCLNWFEVDFKVIFLWPKQHSLKMLRSCDKRRFVNNLQWFLVLRFSMVSLLIQFLCSKLDCLKFLFDQSIVALCIHWVTCMPLSGHFEGVWLQDQCLMHCTETRLLSWIKIP